MRARLTVPVPFVMNLPSAVEFKAWQHSVGDLIVQSRIPARTERPLVGVPDLMNIDGRPAVHADAVVIDFIGNSFDRRLGAPVDPPLDVLDAALNGFLSHLRIVTRAPQVRAISLKEASWRLQYLRDDESEFEPEAGLARAKGASQFSLFVLAIASDTWDAVHSFDSEYRAPIWFNLLYDALDMMGTKPDPAIVQGAAAMEVFAAGVLNDLAARSPVPPALWSWINGRDRYEKNPDLEEQLDILLKVLCGHSLKENERVWEKLMNLRTARNKFVHEGQARVGGAPIDRQVAADLILNAREVVSTVRGWLPEAIRWPEFELKTEVKSMMRIAGDALPDNAFEAVEAANAANDRAPDAGPG
jgi:hypothetical protein